MVLAKFMFNLKTDKMKKSLTLLIVVNICLNVYGQNWEQFGKYWYDGTAEISSYALTQARYGELHEGEAVLVFVTEPFSAAKHVKLDKPTQEAVTVMKLNFTKKFITGIYPYSMMMSSFVPVSIDQYPKALKVTGSIQEWCGHTFTQLNLSGTTYKYQGNSYFESEGDLQATLKTEWLEDAIWQRLRIDPKSAPVGSFSMMPGVFYERLAHKKPVSIPVQANLSAKATSEMGTNDQWVYTLNHEGRNLTIYIEKEFPYQILGWTETYGGLTTKAIKKETIKSKYWELNKKKNLGERTKLGLSTKSE